MYAMRQTVECEGTFAPVRDEHTGRVRTISQLTNSAASAMGKRLVNKDRRTSVVPQADCPACARLAG